MLSETEIDKRKIGRKSTIKTFKPVIDIDEYLETLTEFTTDAGYLFIITSIYGSKRIFWSFHPYA